MVQRTQHALGTARAVEMRHNCAGSSVNTGTETTRAVRACIGVRDLCVEAGAFGPNVQNDGSSFSDFYAMRFSVRKVQV